MFIYNKIFISDMAEELFWLVKHFAQEYLDLFNRFHLIIGCLWHLNFHNQSRLLEYTVQDLY